MNIGIFTDVYKPSINGVTTSIEVFRTRLLALGHRVVVFAPVIPGELPEDDVIRLPAIQHLSPENFPIGLPVRGSMDAFVRSLNLDVVHTQHPFFIGQFGRRIADSLGLPHIHTYHTYLTEYAHYFPFPPAEPIVRQYLKRLSRTFCNTTTMTIAPSTAIEQLLRSYGVTRPITINPTGIDLARYHHLSVAKRTKLFDKYHIPPHKQTILFGGRLALEKNLPFLLSCFQEIAARQKQVHLILAGGGPEEGHLRALVKTLRLTGRVSITGYLTHPEIQQFFGAADIFAFTSLTETQGIVIAEAMAGGTPVVAVNAMGPADSVRDGVNGYLTTYSSAEFTAALERLIGDSVLRSRFAKAAQQTAKNFSIETTTDRLLEIYRTPRTASAPTDQLPRLGK